MIGWKVGQAGRLRSERTERNRARRRYRGRGRTSSPLERQSVHPLVAMISKGQPNAVSQRLYRQGVLHFEHDTAFAFECENLAVEFPVSRDKRRLAMDEKSDTGRRPLDLTNTDRGPYIRPARLVTRLAPLQGFEQITDAVSKMRRRNCISFGLTPGE